MVILFMFRKNSILTSYYGQKFSSNAIKSTRQSLFIDELAVKRDYYDWDIVSLKRKKLCKNVISGFCSRDRKRMRVGKIVDNSYTWDRRGLIIRKIVDYSSCQKRPHLRRGGTDSNTLSTCFISNPLIFNTTKYFYN